MLESYSVVYLGAECAQQYMFKSQIPTPYYWVAMEPLWERAQWRESIRDAPSKRILGSLLLTLSLFPSPAVVSGCRPKCHGAMWPSCDCHASKTVSQTQSSAQTVSSGVLSQWWEAAQHRDDRIRGLLHSEILKELTFLLLEMYLFSFLVALIRIYYVRTSSRIRVNVTKIKVLFPENYKNCWKELKSTLESRTGRQDRQLRSDP